MWVYLQVFYVHIRLDIGLDHTTRLYIVLLDINRLRCLGQYIFTTIYVQ